MEKTKSFYNIKRQVFIVNMGDKMNINVEPYEIKEGKITKLKYNKSILEVKDDENTNIEKDDYQTKIWTMEEGKIKQMLVKNVVFDINHNNLDENDDILGIVHKFLDVYNFNKKIDSEEKETTKEVEVEKTPKVETKIAGVSETKIPKKSKAIYKNLTKLDTISHKPIHKEAVEKVWDDAPKEFKVKDIVPLLKEIYPQSKITTIEQRAMVICNYMTKKHMVNKIRDGKGFIFKKQDIDREYMRKLEQNETKVKNGVLN